MARSATAAIGYVSVTSVQRLSGLLVMPIVAATVPVAEFGSFGVLATVGALGSIVFGLGLESAVFRAHFVKVGGDETAYLQAVHRLLLGGTLFALLGSGLVIWALGFQGPELLGVDVAPVAVELVAASLLAHVTVLAYGFVRARRNVRTYLVIALSLVALQVAGRLVLVAGLGYGAFAWALVDLVTGVVAALITLTLVRREVTRVPPTDTASRGEALRYGLVLLPHLVFMAFLSTGDRLLVAGSLSLRDVAVYTAVGQFVTAFAMLNTEVTRALMPDFAAAADPGRDVDLRGPVHALTLSAVILSGFSAAGSALLLGLYPSDYQSGRALLPLMAVGVLFLGLYALPANSMAVLAGRTSFFWPASALAVCCSVLVNLMLLPRYGLLMAAVATAASSGVLLAAASVAERRVSGRLRRREFERVLSWEALGATMVAGLCISLSASAGPWLASGLCALLGLTTVILYLRTGSGGRLALDVKKRRADGRQRARS